MALETTATFIGHNECFGLSAEKLKNTIRELIKKGVTDFLSGGQGGFDRLCGRCVYELKKEFPHINNYLVIPYLSFNVYDKELFDSIIYPDGFEKYNFKSAIPARNRYMVDNSGYAICFVLILGAVLPRLMREPEEKTQNNQLRSKRGWRKKE